MADAAMKEATDASEAPGSHHDKVHLPLPDLVCKAVGDRIAAVGEDLEAGVDAADPEVIEDFGADVPALEVAVGALASITWITWTVTG
jgi:hypothetical protein